MGIAIWAQKMTAYIFLLGPVRGTGRPPGRGKPPLAWLQSSQLSLYLTFKDITEEPAGARAGDKFLGHMMNS